MIQSMTGYGNAVVAYKEKKIHVEIKSLNSKALDLNTRIAPLYREKEMEIRQMIAEGDAGGEDRHPCAQRLVLYPVTYARCDD